MCGCSNASQKRSKDRESIRMGQVSRVETLGLNDYQEQVRRGWAGAEEQKLTEEMMTS